MMVMCKGSESLIWLAAPITLLELTVIPIWARDKTRRAGMEDDAVSPATPSPGAVVSDGNNSNSAAAGGLAYRWVENPKMGLTRRTKRAHSPFAISQFSAFLNLFPKPNCHRNSAWKASAFAHVPSAPKRRRWKCCFHRNPSEAHWRWPVLQLDSLALMVGS